MPTLLRLSVFLTLALPLAASAATALPVDNKAQAVAPAAIPPKADPAFLDVVAFVVHTDGGNHKLVVTSGSGLLRVDETDDGYSILYDQSTDHYTGLEHRNYTYWDFSWPEVRRAVRTSKRYETHLEELNAQGVMGDPSAPPSDAPTHSSP